MKVPKQLTVALVGALILFVVPTSAFARDPLTLTKPTAGECLKGGSVYTVAWTPSITAENQMTDERDHVAIAYKADGSAYPLPQNDMVGDDGITYIADSDSLRGTAYSWTVPSQTTDTGFLYIEYHTYIGMTGPKHTRIYPEAASGSFSKAGPFSIDGSAPTAPTPTLTSKTADSVSFTWPASKDEGCKGLVGYRVYRGNEVIATVSSNVTSYTDSGRSAGTAYTYKVSAFDDFAETNSSAFTITTSAAAVAATATAKASPSPSPSQAQSSSPEASASLVPLASPSEAPPSTTFSVGNTTYGNDDAPKLWGRDPIHLEGTSVPGAELVLTVHSTPHTYTVTTDSVGKWESDIPTVDLETGSHTIDVAVRDSAGTLGTATVIARFEIIKVVDDSGLSKSSSGLLPLWGWVTITMVVVAVSGAGTWWYLKKRKPGMRLEQEEGEGQIPS